MSAMVRVIATHPREARRLAYDAINHEQTLVASCVYDIGRPGWRAYTFRRGGVGGA